MAARVHTSQTVPRRAPRARDTPRENQPAPSISPSLFLMNSCLFWLVMDTPRHSSTAVKLVKLQRRKPAASPAVPHPAPPRETPWARARKRAIIGM